MTADRPASGVRYRRILLKLSGEALMGRRDFGIEPEVVNRIAGEVADIHNMGCEVAIVVGGGNIFRGVNAGQMGMDRVNADYMGMLATVINALALRDAVERRGVATRVLSAIEMRQVAELFILKRALRHLEKGRVVIFAAGTGNPFFTTDSAAALRAAEISADVILKATKVDGIYTADPKRDPQARHIPSISYLEVLQRNLQVMDSAATSLCMENKIPIVVFNLLTEGNIARAVRGEAIGSTVGA